MTTTLTINASTDCWTDKFGNFDDTDTVLYVGESVNDLDRDPRDWFLFTVPLARNQTIISADLFVTASHSSATTGDIEVGCEDATSPAAPVDGADLNGRVMNWAQGATLEAYSAGVEYHYDIDIAIAGVLARSDWTYGATLAVMIDDVATAKIHRVYSVRNGSSVPYIQIVVPSFVPRGGMW